MDSGIVRENNQTEKNSVENVEEKDLEGHSPEADKNGAPQEAPEPSEEENNNVTISNGVSQPIADNTITNAEPPPQAAVRKKPKPRRRIHHGSVKRESTPMRYLAPGDEMTDVSSDTQDENKELNGTKDVSSSSTTSENISRQGSFRKTHAKKGSFSELAHQGQQELASLLSKTKKSITTAAQKGRDRFRKYEQQLAKRSQSAPKYVESVPDKAELIAKLEDVQRKSMTLGAQKGRERFRKFNDQEVKRSRSVPYKYIEDLNEGLPKIKTSESVADGDNGLVTKPLTNGNILRVKPKEETLLRKRQSSSSRVIEVLDPKTSKVLRRKSLFVGKSQTVAKLKVASIKDVFRNFSIHKKQFHKDYSDIKRTFKKCCCELFLIMIFCGFGGMMFKFTEGAFESYYKCGVRRVKRDFIDLLWTKSHNLREEDWKMLARGRLRKFEEELHSAHEAGMTEYSGRRSWSFLNGIVYCLTIMTTIGYGHMYPKTQTGRALTIVYALIGIPLFLIALTDFGKLFTRGIKFAWSFVRRLYYTGSCRKVRRNSGVDDIFKGAQNLYDFATMKRPSIFDQSNSTNQTDLEAQAQNTDTPTTPAISNFEIDDEFNLPISVALFILVAYIFCGACMYMLIEQWRFFESFYFVFISMSTIGFGDYVPRDPVFMIGSIIYLVFGLALMSMCINVVQAKLSDTFKKASSKIGATMGLQVDDEGSVITASPENIEEVTPVQVENVDEGLSEKK